MSVQLLEMYRQFSAVFYSKVWDKIDETPEGLEFNHGARVIWYTVVRLAESALVYPCRLSNLSHGNV